jgi:hypothetical protein
MIDLTRNNNDDVTADMTQLEATQAMALAYALPVDTCECGDTECLGSAETVNAVVAGLAAALPQLESPLLKLVKERNEARRMCEILAAAMPDLVAVKTSQKACDAANAEMHQAIMTYVKLRKDWDERSWQ